MLRLIRKRWPLLAGALVVVMALAVPFLFDSAAEQSASALAQAKARIAAGDDAAALALLGTALKLDPTNVEAKREVAAAFLRQGKTSQARSVYNDLVAQDPNYLEGLIALGTIAYTTYDYASAKSYVANALAIDPENIEGQALSVALQVEDAIKAKDQEALAKARDGAQGILQANPDDLIALRAAIRASMKGENPASAVPLVDHAVELTNGQYDFEELRLWALKQAGQKEAMVAQMQKMYQAFPDRPAIGGWLFTTLDNSGDYPAARQVLFEEARRAGFAPAQTDKLLEYVRRKGQPGEVLETYNIIIAAAPDPATSTRYVLAAANLEVGNGQAEAAINRLQTLLNSDPPAETAAEAQTMLARIYLAQGKTVEAQDLVRKILSTAPGTVAALKLQARMELDAGNAPQALTALQSALDQSPRDSQVMLLLGETYEKSGALPLAGERFALAVEYSGNGVEETLQDAAFLVRTGRTDRAIEVLTKSVQANPGSIPLLVAAAQAHASQLDWARAQAMVDALTEIGTPDALAAAAQARDTIGATQAILTTTRQVIDRILAESSGQTADAARVVDRMIDQGKPDTAMTYLLDPSRGSDPALLTLRAMIFALNGKPDEAETQLRAILKSDPSNDLAFIGLYGLLDNSGQTPAAATLLDEALTRPEPPVAALLQAADNKAAAGDIGAAISLTKSAYDRNPSDTATAALLSRRIVLDPQATAADLLRARDIAAPLRSLDRPLVLDTLGWVEVRLGTPAAGLTDLQTAGRLRPDDPTIRFHQAMALFALDRRFEAKDALQSYLAMDGDKPALDVEAAKVALQKVETGG